ncbi:response regulator transcription factor [uncultured Nocardioides sp.]|uniref:response regulator transcription factor n=1 Tax=uncultured Nocardioides sp. TaxID=198441 RepID=UPI0025F0BACA|nr:winged helix-turn-helix domain-containing protein [uncultured Nocardioides sp.]
MSAALGSLPQEEHLSDRPERRPTARTHSGRWTETSGAHLLVVDPLGDDPAVRDDMSTRGVHVTWVGSTVDGLVEFGRMRPNAVVIAPDAHGIAAPEFVAKVREYGCSFVIAALDPAHASDAGGLMLAGAGAAVSRPYTAEEIWEVLQRFDHALDDHARVSFGPIELDARAYTVKVGGQRIPDLPWKEFELLRTLLHRAPELLSDADLRASLWGTDAGRPTGNNISVHVARLRTKLEGVARVRRVRGRGYSLTLA